LFPRRTITEMISDLHRISDSPSMSERGLSRRLSWKERGGAGLSGTRLTFPDKAEKFTLERFVRFTF
jgi:hypothetical protein